MSVNPGKTLAGGMFKVKQAVTVPHFKMAKDVQYFFQFVSAMQRAKEVKKSRTAGGETSNERRTPPMMARVIDLTTGELGQIICSAVLEAELNDNYPGDGYVGKNFAITSYKVAGKDYNLIDLAEIEVDEAIQTAAQAAAEKHRADTGGTEPEAPEEGAEEEPVGLAAASNRRGRRGR